MNEIWKEIKEFPDYEISNFGNLRHKKIKKRQKIKNQYGEYYCYRTIPSKIIKSYHITKQGYIQVCLHKNNKTYYKYLHKLVMQTFNENINDFKISNKEYDMLINNKKINVDKIEINHIDGNKLNNKLSNLEYVTSSYNKQHAIENNLRKIKKILMIDKDNNIIKEFKSMKEAKIFLNVPETSGLISMACNNKRLSAYGYKWEFKEKEN